MVPTSPPALSSFHRFWSRPWRKSSRWRPSRRDLLLLLRRPWPRSAPRRLRLPPRRRLLLPRRREGDADRCRVLWEVGDRPRPRRRGGLLLHRSSLRLRLPAEAVPDRREREREQEREEDFLCL